MLGSLSNGVENHNTPVVSSENHRATGSTEEVAVDGGGSFTGLAPMAVAEVKSIIASPE